MTRSKNIGLIRDVLDKLLVDRDGMPVGRVDGIVLVLSGEHSRPRVIQIESGAITLGRRLNAELARVLPWMMRKIGLRWRQPVRLPWSRVAAVGRELKVDLCAQDSALLASERWLRDHVMRRIPGSGKQKQSAK
jgi:hypothetical protein